MNATAATMPLTQHEEVKAILTPYAQNGMGKEKSDAEKLLGGHFEYMETQFEKVLDELQNIRSQLQTMENKSVQTTVTRIIDTVDAKINDVKTRFTGIKFSIVKSFSDAVATTKERGFSALKNTLDFFKVHSALSFLKGKLGKAIESLQQGIAQIEKVNAKDGGAYNQYQ